MSVNMMAVSWRTMAKSSEESPAAQPFHVRELLIGSELPVNSALGRSMTPHTQWRVESAARVTASCVAVSLVYELVDTRGVSFAALYIGIGLAMPLILLEESGFDRRMRRLPFTAALLARTLTYLGSIAGVFMSVGFVAGYLEGRTLAEFRDFITSAAFGRQLTAGFC